MEKWIVLLRSRKFWAAVVGLVMVVVKAFWPDFPLGEDQIVTLAYVLVAYILGVALEDGLRSTPAGESRPSPKDEAGSQSEESGWRRGGQA